MRSSPALVGLIAAVLVAPSALAAWANGTSGGSTSRAKTLGSGSVPAVSVAGKKVTVTWAASTFTTGGNVPGYLIRRYDAVTGTLQTIGANCSGISQALTCTENNVPSGSWQYTVTPAAGNWRGAESGKSARIP
jgi:hypothetical protein